MTYAQYKDCSWCGKEYWADKPQRLYCSIDCRTAHRWSVHDPYIWEWRKQYLSGDSYKTIAERYGKPTNTIRGALQYNRVEPRNRWDTITKIWEDERNAQANDSCQRRE